MELSPATAALIDAIATLCRQQGKAADVTYMRRMATLYQLDRPAREHLAGKCALPPAALAP